MATRIDQALLEKVNHARRNRDWVAIDRFLAGLGKHEIASEPELGLALSVAWSHMFRDDEATSLLNSIEAKVLASNDEDLYRRWLAERTSKLILKGLVSEASDMLLLVTELSERAGDDRRLAFCYNNRGIIECYLGKCDEAVAAFTRSLVSNRAAGDHHGVAMAQYNIGLTLRVFERLEDAVPYVMLAQDGWDSWGLVEERTMALAERAILATMLEDVELGSHLSTVAVGQARGLSSPAVYAIALRARAIALAAAGRLRDALANTEEAIELLSKTIYSFSSAAIREDAAKLAFRLELHSEAARYWQEADAIYGSMGAAWWQENARRSMRSLLEN